MESIKYISIFKDNLLSLDSAYLILAGLVFSVLYTVSVFVYRLWLSPIAAFPGPFLARLTFWYEFYYDWVKTGKYYLRIQEMHEKYGPIVRVSPHELHINDPYFYRKLFVTGVVRKTNLYHRFGTGTGFEDLIAASIKHDSHRSAIAPLTTYFSRAGISRVEQRIVDRVRKLGNRLEAHAENNEIVNLFNAMSSFTSDVISSIVFKEPSDLLGDSEYNEEWFTTLKHGVVTVPLLARLPWLARIIVMPVLRALSDRYTNWRLWDDKARREMMQSKRRPADEAKTRSDTTMFDYIVHNEEPEWTKSQVQPTRVAQFLQQAGSYNVSYSMTAIVVYLSLNKDKEETLCRALAPLFADGGNDQNPAWKDLEKVPYLSACIKEGLRLTGGSMFRAPRVSPDRNIQYGEWIIPSGTPVSMLSYWMHMNPDIFDDPNTFRPERWLESPPEKLEQMNTSLVPFSKGSRSCLGQHLASMQMNHILAWFYRPGAPRISLYETDESAIIPVHGLLFPTPPLRSQVQIRLESEG